MRAAGLGQPHLNTEHISDVKPLVSIIVPVYNVWQYLAACVSSLVQQTYPNLEILLIDDGSTDGSGELCDALASSDARIAVFHKQNGGLSDARNFGIDRAHGSLLTFVDSDDLISDEFVSILTEPFLSDSRVDISLCLFRQFLDGKDPNLREAGKVVPDHSISIDFTREDVLSKLCQSNESVVYETAWGKLYAANIFENVRFPKGMIHEDTATTYRLVMESRHIRLLQHELYHYRSRANSIMTSSGNSENTDLCEILEARDLAYTKSAPSDIALANRFYSLNALMRAFYQCHEVNTARRILDSYRLLYRRGLRDLPLSSRARAFIQFYAPRFCKAFYSLAHAKHDTKGRNS